MTIQIKLFGLLADVVGKNELQVKMENDTNSLIKNIILNFPALQAQPFAVAVNKKISKANLPLNTGDEVTLLPPFAGG